MAVNTKAELNARAFIAGLTLEKKIFESLVKDQQAIIGTAIFTSVVETTPVLTGKARRNWIPSLDTPSSEKTDEVAGVSVTGAPLTADEKSRVGSVMSELRNSKLGRKFHVANNQPYVPFLDEGSSQKAPEGIRLVAVTKAIARLKGGNV